MLTAVLLAPLAVVLGQVLARDGLELVPVATTVGVLAAVVQFLGLARWPFLVPALARTYDDPTSSPAAREATAVVSTPSIATSASPSASASATCSLAPGRCSSPAPCSSRRRSETGWRGRELLSAPCWF